MYTVDYFIKKFEAIPEEKWCSYHFYNASGQRCANGHCGIDKIIYEGLKLKTTEESRGLYKALKDLKVHDTVGYLVEDEDQYSNKAATINNGATMEYKQPTPKQRILAALYDVKSLQAVKEAQKIVSEELEVA